jgi:hypothetical protein
MSLVMNMKISRSTIGLAAEFAVASELGRRNIYAQPTFGHQKRTDLLIFGKDNELLKVEVKGKQGREWPNCKGIYGRNVILVFVDFAGKTELERPDFYILEIEDWLAFVQSEITRRPDKNVIIDERNTPVWTTQLNERGQPYCGIGVRAEQIQRHKERWDKIIQRIGQIGPNDL